MTRNVYAGVCVAAAFGVAAPAIAQTGDDAPKTLNGKTVTVIGCLQASTRGNSFALSVPQDATAGFSGSRVRLITPDLSKAREHTGQEVEILGTILGSRRSDGASRAPSRIYVRDIRQVAPQCDGSTPPAAAAPIIPGPPAAPAPTAISGTAPSAISSPPRAPSGVTSNTSTPSDATRSTTASSGTLAQTGFSGNAILTGPGGTAATTPSPAKTGASSVAAPVNTAASSVPAPTVSASAPASTPTKAASMPMTAGTMAVPANAASMPTTNSTPMTNPTPTTNSMPVDASGGPAVAQRLANTSTIHGTLSQTGVSGDALLTGLVNVNVQQLMAAVQAQANVPVQADVIVNLSNIANDLQVQALVQALNTNPQASMNANDLTSALRSAGLIDPSQFVVGVTGSEIMSNTDLTTKLQQRGIISPSETIMSTLPGRIFVAQP
jgi:hypothetical protein